MFKIKYRWGRDFLAKKWKNKLKNKKKILNKNYDWIQHVFFRTIRIRICNTGIQTLSFYPFLLFMVIILHGNSELDAHVRCNLCHLIWHLIESGHKSIFFLFRSCVRNIFWVTIWYEYQAAFLPNFFRAFQLGTINQSAISVTVKYDIFLQGRPSDFIYIYIYIYRYVYKFCGGGFLKFCGFRAPRNLFSHRRKRRGKEGKGIIKD